MIPCFETGVDGLHIARTKIQKYKIRNCRYNNGSLLRILARTLKLRSMTFYINFEEI